MKELKTEKVDLFVSNESFRELQERFKGSSDMNGDIASYLSDKVDDLYREDEKFRKYIEMHSEISKLKGLAVLEAEEVELSSWTEGYLDGKRKKRIQSWINKHDGEYACLFICVSGINGYGLKSNESLLFIPDQGTSDRVFSLVSPLHDNIDMYTIDYYLKDIETFLPESIKADIEYWSKEYPREKESDELDVI